MNYVIGFININNTYSNQKSHYYKVNNDILKTRLAKYEHSDIALDNVGWLNFDGASDIASKVDVLILVVNDNEFCAVMSKLEDLTIIFQTSFIIWKRLLMFIWLLLNVM